MYVATDVKVHCVDTLLYSSLTIKKIISTE